MIDLRKEISLHPDRAEKHLAFLEECLEVYHKSLETALRHAKIQSENIEAVTKTITTIKLWKKQEGA